MSGKVISCAKCKEKIGKFLLWTPASWLVAVVSAAALAMLLIPLIRLAFYAVPWYDDYNFGKYVKNFLEQEYSLKSALAGALYCVKSEWYAWQGDYTANFLDAIVPAVWGEKYYFLGPLSIISILLVAVCALTGTLMRTVLKVTDRTSCVIVQSVVAAVAIVLLYSPREGFFWYNGGMCYVGAHSFLMLLIVAWIKLLTGKKVIPAIFLLIGTMTGAAVVAGSTYVTTLQGLLIGLSIVALGMLLRNRRFMLLFPSILVYIYGFYKSAIAPGNNVRKAVLEEMGIGMDAVPAIINSFIEAFRQMGKFTDMVTILMLILLLPFIWKMVHKSISFRYPGLLLLWSFCLYAAGFTPCLYSLGSIGPERALNVIKLTYQLLLFINEVYWAGWLRRKLDQAEKVTLFGWCWEKKESSATTKNPPVIFYLAVGVLIFGTGFINPDRERSYSSYGAYCSIHSGEAYNFYQEYHERMEKIVNGGDVVAVKPYHYRPWMLCMGELTEDMYSGPNRAIAKWYDKEAIVLETED